MQIVNTIRNWFGGAKNAAQNTSNYAANQIGEIANQSREAAQNTARSASESVKGLAQNPGAPIASAKETISNTANKAGDWVEHSITNAGDAVGNTANAAKNTAYAAGEKANELVGAAGASVSNLGIKSQTSGSWWKKGLPLLLILAVGFWAVAHFTGFNPLASLWNKTESGMQTLEANVDGAMEATGEMASSTVETVKGAFSSFSLPNGENIEFTEGSFGHELTGFLTGNEMEENKVFTFDNLNFTTGSAEIQEESKIQIDNLGKVLNAMPSVHIKIEGHTDNTGNAAANKLLSQQRAETVKQYLVLNAGIDSQRIETSGFGSDKPIVANDTDENRAKNRRIDLVVTKK